MRWSLVVVLFITGCRQFDVGDSTARWVSDYESSGEFVPRSADARGGSIRVTPERVVALESGDNLGLLAQCTELGLVRSATVLNAR